MGDLLPTAYLSLLVALLAGTSWFVFRQILRTRKMESNLSVLRSKLSQDRGSAQEYYELGSIYLSKKLYSQAIAQFQKAIKAGQTTPAEESRIYNALGFAYFSQEQYDLAIRQYKEALKRDPKYVVAFNNLANAYEKKQLLAQALEAYEQALSFDPNNAIAKRRAESLRRRVLPST
ncbi:tetratricopeptide repeat protein [Trichothermofontia sp.]